MHVIGHAPIYIYIYTSLLDEMMMMMMIYTMALFGYSSRLRVRAIF
jgi:hypothetical protein